MLRTNGLTGVGARDASKNLIGMTGGLQLHDNKRLNLLYFTKTVGIVLVGALYGEDKSSFAAMCSAGTINKCNF